MLIIEMAKIELIGGHIGIMLIVEMAKIELTSGHIGIMLIIIHIDYQNRIKLHSYWNFTITIILLTRPKSFISIYISIFFESSVQS